MSKTVIELQNIKRNFQVGDETVHALRGVSFSIGEGEFVTIMGTSGSGIQIMVSVRTFFRNGQPQVYFDIRESNHGVIYFLCYDYVFGGKVTKIFIFPYSFFIIIFYLCRPD